MRKKLLLLGLITCLLFTGCGGNKKDKAKETDIVIDESKVFDNSTLDGESYTWTQDNQTKLEEALKSKSYMKFTQSTKNMSAENNAIFTYMNYDIKVDTNTKVTNVVITDGSTKDNKENSSEYANDLINDLHYEKLNNTWSEAENQTKELAWNLKELKNGYDIVNNLYNLSDLKINTTGKIQGKYVYFDFINNNQEKPLFGVNYTSLGSNTTTVIIDTETMLPMSIINNIEYKIDDEDYIVQSSLIFEQFGVDNMTLESLGIKLPEGFVKKNE